MNELEKMNAWANKINKKNKKKYGGLRPPMNYNSGNPLINNSIFNSQYGDKDVDSTSVIKNIIDVDGGIGGDISVMGANSSISNNAVGGDSGASVSEDMNQFNSSNSTLDENSNRYRKVKKALYGDPSGKIKSFAIISPQNPLGWKDSTEEEFINKFKMWTANKHKYNKMSNDELLSHIDDFKNNIESNGDRALRYGHFSYVPLKGHYGDSEKSYLILNLTLNGAKIIAKDYGQESFFYGEVHSDNSIISYYVTNNGYQSYPLVEKSKIVTDESEANDFYSKFGCKFRINMKEFGDDIPELEEDMNTTFMSRARNRNTGFDSTYVTK